MLRKRLGFTLIEVLVATMIIGLMLPPLGAAFYNFTKVPPEETHELTAINDVTLAIDWVAEDASKAQVFIGSGSSGSFFWRDYTTPGELHRHAVFYSHDDLNDRIMREEWIDNQLYSSHPVAYHIINSEDVEFEPIPGRLIKISVKSSVPHWGGYQTDEGTAFLFLNAQSYLDQYTVLAAGGPAVSKSIKIPGKDILLQGLIRSNGYIHVTGQDNTLDGDVWLAYGNDYDISPGNNWPDEPNWVDYLDYDWPFGEDAAAWVASMGGATFTFDENTLNLASRETDDDGKPIWDEDNPNMLKPGIYYNINPSGNLMIGKDDVSGTVTLISNSIQINKRVNLMPFAEGLLLWGTATGAPEAPPDAISTQTSQTGTTLNGILYAPGGSVFIGGSNLTINGSCLAQVFEINSSGGEVVIRFFY